MNKKRLIQAAIDLTVAVLAGYIVILVPVTGPTSQPPATQLPGKLLMVQIEAFSEVLQGPSGLEGQGV
ncbi:MULTISPECIES: hypothetical protein [Pseudomonas syringae group]|uniref:hypothetical protein n=1 Tax=Pseudomonas syringae group TaxID=136849 RepID=UPI000EFEBF7B|nr:hypothetical protein [Pseudomonas syringae group genomosp. 3]